MANREEVVPCNGRQFKLTIRENQGRYVARVEVLDVPFLPPKLQSAVYADVSCGKVEEQAREWMLRWKK